MLDAMLFLNKYQRIDNPLSRICGFWLRFIVLSAFFATTQAWAKEPEPAVPVTVQRVEEDATLTLQDGRVVKLDMLEITDPKHTSAMLKPMLEGKSITLSNEQLDRYGKLVGMVWVEDRSVQHQLLQSGAAMVLATRPDKAVQALLDIEAIARKQRLGLWKNTEVMIEHEHARKAIGTVKIVSGVVRAVAVKSGVGYINFGEDWRTDFSIQLPKKTMRNFGKQALEALVGHKVFVRGLIHDYYGPRITLYDPNMLETHAD